MTESDWPWLRPFGNTGLSVSAIGLGAGQLGMPADADTGAVTDAQADALLGAALDLGVNLVDTARSYGESERRIGQFLRGRRDRVVVSTKVGYGIPGHADWTGGCVAAGVDAALGRLGTDWIDIVHLHSCPRDVLEAGDVIAALQGAKRAGKIRAVAYSGDNAAADWAAVHGDFDSVQTSVSPWDQRSIDAVVEPCRQRGLGVIAKRPLANAPWRFESRPVGDECEPYWERYRALGVDPGDLPWHEVAVRFSAHVPGVCSAITGTRSPDHLRSSVELARRGPLPAHLFAALRQGFRTNGGDWDGRI